MTRDALQAAVGSALRLGVVELEVTAVPEGCPGVYASVRTPGKVSVGDPVETSA
jgi:MOSC domain-containing protein YiiM